MHMAPITAETSYLLIWRKPGNDSNVGNVKTDDYDLAKVDVVGSNPIAAPIFPF